MITFYLLLLIPFVFALCIKFGFHKSISWLEMFSMLIVSSILISVVYWAGIYSETADTLLINGQVTAKEMNRVHCRHSYPCNCRTRCSGSGKSRSCSTVCDTCYVHSFDNDWDVHTTIGDWRINTIDSQGLKEPPRWTSIKKLDPVTKSESYVNYVKAVPESLFNFDMKLVQEFKGSVPKYPIDIYDYYRVNRLLVENTDTSGKVIFQMPDSIAWNNDLSLILGELGPSKQVNAVIVVTKQSNSMYSKALQASWIGGKKNDVVVVIGTPEYPKIRWVTVFGWAKNDIFNVQLRDDIREIGVVDRTKIIPAIKANILKSYVRKPMEEYEYLKEQIEPPLWVSILAIILSLISLGWLTYYFNKIDLGKELFGWK